MELTQQQMALLASLTGDLQEAMAAMVKLRQNLHGHALACEGIDGVQFTLDALLPEQDVQRMLDQNSVAEKHLVALCGAGVKIDEAVVSLEAANLRCKANV